MSKHTPGPWWIRGDLPNEPQVSFPVIKVWMDAGKSLTICNVGNNNAYREKNLKHQDWYNARLIAASPDLLAVLKELQESAAYWSEYDVPLGIVDRINKAIAKAEGA